MTKKRFHLLCAQSERGTGDARRQMQSLDDLLPQFLVDDVDEAATGDDQIVQFVQVQHRLGHDRQAVDRGAWKQIKTKNLKTIYYWAQNPISKYIPNGIMFYYNPTPVGRLFSQADNENINSPKHD